LDVYVPATDNSSAIARSTVYRRHITRPTALVAHMGEPLLIFFSSDSPFFHPRKKEKKPSGLNLCVCMKFKGEPQSYEA
jgi:predicted alpha/beta-fold hydrolase